MGEKKRYSPKHDWVFSFPPVSFSSLWKPAECIFPTHERPIKTSGVCERPGPVRAAAAAAALGAESFIFFFPQIIFKAFKYIYFHNTRIKNTSRLLSQSGGRPQPMKAKRNGPMANHYLRYMESALWRRLILDVWHALMIRQNNFTFALNFTFKPAWLVIFKSQGV